MAEDEEGFAFYGSMAARTADATRDGTNTATSTTSELAAFIWTYAYIYAQHCESTDRPSVVVHTDSLVAKGFADGTFIPKKPDHLTRLARVLFDLAQSVTDMRTDHVYAHSGHPWNELADSLAKRQTRKEEGSPPAEDSRKNQTAREP